MILSEICDSQTAFHEMMNIGIYTDEPFEFLIKTIYENEMIIQSTNLSLMVKDYEYLKETGNELTLIDEGGIVSTIFSGLFKLVKKAAQAVASFFKSIFRKNSEKIEQTEKETANIKNSSNSKPNTSTINKPSTSNITDVSKSEPPANNSTDTSKSEPTVTVTWVRAADHPKNATPKSDTTNDTNDMHRDLDNAKKLDSQIKKLKKELADVEANTIKDILKDPTLLSDDVYIERRLICIDSSKLLNEAGTCAEFITDHIIHNAERILVDEYNSFNNVYSNRHVNNAYLSALNMRDYNKDMDKFESGKFKLSVNQFYKFLNNRFRLLYETIPVMNASYADILDIYGKNHTISSADKLADIIDESVLMGKKTLRDNYVREMKLTNSKCSDLFERAKKEIKYTEDCLKKLQGYAQQTESQIQKIQKFSAVDGTTDPEKIKKMLTKYFNGLNRCASSLISQCTDNIIRAQRSYGSFISLIIDNNTQFVKEYDSVHKSVNKLIHQRKKRYRQRLIFIADIYRNKRKIFIIF